MAIIATFPHSGESLDVEVLDTYYSETRRRRMATVQALKGEPFCYWTHGGYAYSGEILYIWGDKKRGVFLKEQGGTVDLCIIGYGPSCPLFWLNLDIPTWEPFQDATNRYEAWVKRYQENQVVLH